MSGGARRSRSVVGPEARVELPAHLEELVPEPPEGLNDEELYQWTQRERRRVTLNQQGRFTATYFEDEMILMGGQRMLATYADPRVRVMQDARAWESHVEMTHGAVEHARNAQRVASALRLMLMGYGLPMSVIMAICHKRMFKAWRDGQRVKGSTALAAPMLEDETKREEARRNARGLLLHNVTAEDRTEYEQLRLFGRVVAQQTPSRSDLVDAGTFHYCVWHFDPLGPHEHVKADIERIRKLAIEEGRRLEQRDLEEIRVEEYQRGYAAGRRDERAEAQGRAPELPTRQVDVPMEIEEPQAGRTQASEVATLTAPISEAGVPTTSSATIVGVQRPARTVLPLTHGLNVPEATASIGPPMESSFRQEAIRHAEEWRQEALRGQHPVPRAAAATETSIPKPGAKRAAQDVSPPAQTPGETTHRTAAHAEGFLPAGFSDTEEEKDEVDYSRFLQGIPKKRRRARARRYQPAGIERGFWQAATDASEEIKLVALGAPDALTALKAAKSKVKCPDAERRILTYPNDYQGSQPATQCDYPFCQAANMQLTYQECENVQNPHYGNRSLRDALKDITMRTGPYDMTFSKRSRRRYVNIGMGGADWSNGNALLEKYGFYESIVKAGYFVFDLEGFSRKDDLAIRTEMAKKGVSEDLFKVQNIALLTMCAPNGVLLNFQVNWTGEKHLRSGQAIPRGLKSFFTDSRLRKAMFGGYGDMVKLRESIIPECSSAVDISNLVVQLYPQFEVDLGQRKPKCSKGYYAQCIKCPVYYHSPNGTKATYADVTNFYTDYVNWDWTRDMSKWSDVQLHYQFYDCYLALTAMREAAVYSLLLDGANPNADVIRATHRILDALEGYPRRTAVVGLERWMVFPNDGLDWVKEAKRAQGPVAGVHAPLLWDKNDQTRVFGDSAYVVQKERTGDTRYTPDGCTLPEAVRLAYENKLDGRLDLLEAVDRMIYGGFDKGSMRQKFIGNPSRGDYFPHLCLRCGEPTHPTDDCKASVKCIYSFCNNKESHDVAVCPTILEVCTICGARGHRAADHQKYSVHRLLEEYRIAKYAGALTCRAYDRSDAYRPVVAPDGVYEMVVEPYEVDVMGRLIEHMTGTE